MGRTVAIGIQNYNQIIENNYYYVDKTAFIKEWWDGGDSVTLITRPRLLLQSVCEGVAFR